MPFLKILLAAIKSDLFLPALVVLGYVIFIVLVRGSLPNATELIEGFGSLYAKYGYGIIFLSAFLEGLAVVSFFVPGSLAVALGAVFARTGQVELTFVVLTAAAGASTSYVLDFILGYLGFSDIFKKLGYGGVISKAKRQLIHSRSGTWVLGFAHPNIAAFVSLAAGTVKMNFAKFFTIAVLSSLVWATAWGVLIYSVGEVVLQILTRYSFLVVIALVAGLFLSRFVGRGEKD